MSRYIDSEKLIAEIERRKKELSTIGGDTFENMWACGTLDNIKEFITSLQNEQPEVDLEKEITRWLDKGDITDTRFDDYDDADIERTARHFYELGLNTRKK